MREEVKARKEEEWGATLLGNPQMQVVRSHVLPSEQEMFTSHSSPGSRSPFPQRGWKTAVVDSEEKVRGKEDVSDGAEKEEAPHSVRWERKTV